MKRKQERKICIVFLLMALLASALAGCGAKGSQNTDIPPTVTATPTISAVENGETPSPEDTGDEVQPSPTPPVDSGDEIQHDPESPEGDVVTVSSVEELLEAIGPYTGIIIKPGYYNLSEYIEDVWNREGEGWNERHPYVQLRDCYDGVEVFIRRVNELSIHGDNENLTEIVVEPRYAQVLNFEECDNITLFGLTMGHTETGDCDGNVLDFYGCRNINLSAMDIYGCGVYGIGCYNGTGEMYVYSSTIRDCSYGALEILDGNGRFEFHNCMLTGSEAYDCYEPTPYSELAFYECVFGDNETSYYMFLEDIYTENCIWSENYEYPEYGYEEWIEFDPDTMESVAIDEGFFNDTFWVGYAMVNPESGETVMIPYEEPDGTFAHVSLELNGDGTGYFENTNEFDIITWTYDEDSILYVTLEDGRNYYASAWTMGDNGYIWLLLELEGYMVWLY